MIINPITGWLALAVSLLAARASAKDFQLTLWNSSDCTRLLPDTISTILQIPRDNDDPNAGIRCASIVNHNFDGWARDTHSEQVVAHVDTHSIQKGCQWIFYNKGPTPDQLPEQIDTGPCWQAYRRVSKTSSCSSVSFDAGDIALS